MADNLTREQRSMTMSRIRSRDTLPEMILRRLLHAEGCRFRLHVVTLPGKPDLVFQRARVVVFIDGDFWHGWRFSAWAPKLAPYWRQKIAGNRARDARNFRRLRRQGWLVLRIWEHQIERDPQTCVARVLAALKGGGQPASKLRTRVWQRLRYAQLNRPGFTRLGASQSTVGRSCSDKKAKRSRSR
jgi:DNA mismatch endonuclease (patch repair protein)